MNGMPHGIGYILSSTGQKIEMEWHEGVSVKKVEENLNSVLKNPIR